MTKLLHVAREELSYHLRQWAFYIVALAMPLIFASAGLLPQLQNATQETPLAQVETIFTETTEVKVPTGYVDYAGIIRHIPPEQAKNLRPFEAEAQARAALDQAEIESYYVIDADYIQNGRVTQYSNNPQLLAGVDDVVQRLLKDNLLTSLDNETLAHRLEQPVKLVRRGPPPAAFSFLPSETDLQKLASAGLVLLLFAYLINVGGNLILRSLQREVRARVLEVLIVSTTPEQFIGGKLLALTSLTMGQGLLTLIAGAVVYGREGNSFGPAALPWSVLALSVPYLLLGYVTYCGGLMGLATIWPNLPESGTLLAIIRLLMFSPLIGILFILPNPDGLFAVGLTLFPLTAPLLMPFRLLLGEVPLWQWGLGLGLLLAIATFSVWLSARLFRMQSLLTGRTPSPRMLWVALWG
jgi:ABC-2 type transport system permease protein